MRVRDSPWQMEETLPGLLMAGAARINKGLDVIAGLAELLARDARLAAAEGVSSTNELLAEPPLLVQVSPKHVGKTGHDRHGAREDAVVARLLAANYRGLVADPKAPDRATSNRLPMPHKIECWLERGGIL